MSWINPIALQLGPFSIHWYGLMYAITFLIAYFILKYHRLARKLPLNENQKDNLLVSIILGIILGGRLGYILFYNLNYYLQNPLEIPAIWKGGLSFHGGLIGTIIAVAIYAHLHRKEKHLFLKITDIAVLITPIGIMLGRIGNFINGELYGRVASNLCLNFPTDPFNCRYPSQLFESLGEGLLLGLFLHLLARNNKISSHPGQLSTIFLIAYGLIRFLIEYTREPDSQLGYLLGAAGFFQGLTLGQILSLLMSLAGAAIWLKLRRNLK